MSAPHFLQLLQKPWHPYSLHIRPQVLLSVERVCLRAVQQVEAEKPLPANSRNKQKKRLNISYMYCNNSDWRSLGHPIGSKRDKNY